MAESPNTISETLLLARLERADEMRAFFLRMWMENPALAKGAGERIGALLQPLGAVPPAPTLPGMEKDGGLISSEPKGGWGSWYA